MLIIFQGMVLLLFFLFSYLLAYYVALSVFSHRLKGEISIFEKIAVDYKTTIIAFNNKIFKLKLKEQYIPYAYLIIVNIFGLFIFILTKTAILWIFFLVLLYYFPGFVLRNIQRQRTSKIEKQLVSALIFLGNALKAGLDIVQGLELAVDSLEAPISEEFAQVLHEYHFGSSLEEALINMRDKIDSRYVDTFVTSIIIQRESGGDVTKIIEQIIQTVRSSYKLRGKIRALTAQGRVQSIIVIMLPWVLGVLLLAIQPDFILPMFRTTVGFVLLSILVVWQFIGIIVIKKVVTIEV